MKANDGWQEIRTQDGRFLFRFHPVKNLIEQKRGNIIHLVDLDDGTVTQRQAETNHSRGGKLNLPFSTI